MAAWFTAVAPFLPDIIQMAKPIFTRGKGEEKAPDLVPRQITELQDAAALNAESVRVLAAEMQQTLTVLRQASAELEGKLERANRMSLVALTAAALAFAVAAYALAT